MTTPFAATTGPMPHAEAMQVSDTLEQAICPEALSVSATETDEAARLWSVEALYEVEPSPAELARALAFAGIEGVEFSTRQLPQTNWVLDALSSLAPVIAGRVFVHGSHDRHLRPHGSLCLEIDAGLAFGTGHHHTTRGCLLALQDVLKRRRPMSVLDVGCGSGVLAIAAARLAQAPAIASDIDPEATRVAAANARLNGVAPLVECHTATGLQHRAIAGRAPFDLVFANILAGPLLALAPELARATSQNGHLILAGLTQGQAQQIIARYRAYGMVLTARIDLEDWAVLTFTHAKRERREPFPFRQTPG